jgi:hypothetical protein
MASTYVNDLRLNEMATGDASGSWGTVTNTNLELIGEAFSYGTETIGDADSTLTIADGAADAARSFYLKITSSVDLTTTRIVTLGPNTVSKVWMIENATTGSQVITIKQGSGATINVPNGQVKMISTDGAGSGGAVLDLLVDVDLTGTTTLVNLNVSGAVDIAGDLTLSAGGDGALRFTAASSVKVLDNNAAALVFEEADNAYMTFVTTDGSEAVKFDKALDINAATQIDATVTVGVDDTGYDVKFFGATTGKSLLWDESADSLIVTGSTSLQGGLEVGVDDTGYDVKFFGATAGAYMLWDESADDLILGGAAGLSVNSTALVTGVLTANGGAVFNEGGVDADFRVESDGSTHMLFVDAGGNRVGINESSPDTLLHLSGANNASDVNNALRFTDTDTAVVADQKIGRIEFETSDTSNPGVNLQIDGIYSGSGAGSELVIRTGVAGSLENRMFIQDVETVFNEDGADLDFRVESDTDANALFVQGSDGFVGIGTSSPSYKLHVRGADATAVLVVGNTSEDTRLEVLTYQDDRAVLRANDTSNTARTLAFETGTTERMRIDSSGNVGIGTSSPSYPLDISRGLGDVVRFYGDATNSILIYLGSGYQIFQCLYSGTTNQFGYSGGNFYVDTAGTERMRITAAGNVLVGTSSQIGSEKFGILTTGAGAFAHWKSTGTSGDPQVFRLSTGQLSGGIGSGRFITCDDGGSDKFFVTGAGVVNATSATITTISVLSHRTCRMLLLLKG